MIENIAATVGVSSSDHASLSSPRRARAGYQARKPTGRNVMRPLNMAKLRPSNGNGMSVRSRPDAELLISSVARGAQNARLPQMKLKDSRIVADAATLSKARNSHDIVGSSASTVPDQSNRSNPGMMEALPEKGMKPSVKRAIHTG